MDFTMSQFKKYIHYTYFPRLKVMGVVTVIFLLLIGIVLITKIPRGLETTEDFAAVEPGDFVLLKDHQDLKFLYLSLYNYYSVDPATNEKEYVRSTPAGYYYKLFLDADKNEEYAIFYIAGKDLDFTKNPPSDIQGTYLGRARVPGNMDRVSSSTSVIFSVVSYGAVLLSIKELLILFFILVLGTFLLYLIIVKPTFSPDYSRIKKVGHPKEIFSAFDAAWEAKSLLVQADGFLATRSFLLIGKDFFLSDEFFWVYHVTDKNKSYLRVCLSNGKKRKIYLEEAVIQNVLQEIGEKMPGVIIGPHPEWEKLPETQLNNLWLEYKRKVRESTIQ